MDPEETVWAKKPRMTDCNFSSSSSAGGGGGGGGGGEIVCVCWNEPNSIVCKYLEQLNPVDCLDRHLRIIKFKAYQWSNSELEFAKFLITKARILNVMKLQCETSCCKRWVRAQQTLLCLQNKASSDAQFVFVKDRRCSWEFNEDASNLSFADPFHSRR